MSIITENEKWVLSFYRHSEITGALFFGRLAQYIKNPEIKHDLTKHFSDESLHAWYWEDCLDKLGEQSGRGEGSYQDKYFEAIGIPANLMEILAITHVFEARVINQYNMHMRLPDRHQVIKDTFTKIMLDEAWHLKWVGDALEKMKKEYGADEVENTLKRYKKSDEEVYGKYLLEYEDRLDFLNKGDK